MAKKKTATKTTKKATSKTTKKTAARKKSTDLKKLDETGNRKTERRSKKKVEETVAKETQESPKATETQERRKVQRRRQIDPTTCERDYSDLEIEFMHALDEYKRASGRMFPTCSEILEVILKLGYRKVDISAEQSLESPAAGEPSADSIADPMNQVDETFESIEQLMM